VPNKPPATGREVSQPPAAVTPLIAVAPSGTPLPPPPVVHVATSGEDSSKVSKEQVNVAREPGVEVDEGRDQQISSEFQSHDEDVQGCDEGTQGGEEGMALCSEDTCSETGSIVDGSEWIDEDFLEFVFPPEAVQDNWTNIDITTTDTDQFIELEIDSHMAMPTDVQMDVH